MHSAASKQWVARPLLTETLPYEVPVTFSNEKFFRAISASYSGDLKVAMEKLLRRKDGYTLPYNYEVSKDSNRFTLLSVAHPLTQTQIADLYVRYEGTLLSHCSKSAFSLRRPIGVASVYREYPADPDSDASKSGAVLADPSHEQLDVDYLASYFVYGRFGLLGKFHDSKEYLALESRYPYMRMLDVAKCFYHIYTHSISWAVKSKDFAKQNSQAHSFEAECDKVMQWANYNETNGIIVGPEFSRIFAEVIFQQIDVIVQRGLARDQLIHDEHYAVRRYVDDYYIFARSTFDLDVIQDRIRKELEAYKLYLNVQKCVTLHRPFLTSLSRARGELSDVLADLEELTVLQRRRVLGVTDGDGSAAASPEVSSVPAAADAPAAAVEPASSGGTAVPPLPLAPDSPSVLATPVAPALQIATANESVPPAQGSATAPHGRPGTSRRNDRRRVRRSLDRIRSVIQENGIEVANLSGWILGTLKRIMRSCNDVLGSAPDESDRWLDAAVGIHELAFYICAVDFRVRTTYNICQLVKLAFEAFDRVPPTHAAHLRFVVADGLAGLVSQSQFSRGAGRGVESVETHNILICGAHHLEGYFLEMKAVKDALDALSKLPVSYFGYIAQKFCYLKDPGSFQAALASLNAAVLARLNQRHHARSSEDYLLLCDYLSAPDVNEAEKRKLFDSLFGGTVSKATMADVAKFIGFVDWSGMSIEHILRRKELRPIYSMA